MDAKPDGNAHACILHQTRTERPHGVEDAKPCADRPLRIVLVGLGIAEVDQQAIAEILGDMAVKGLDHLGTGLLIGPHHRAVVFGSSCLASARRVHQITEHHRKLAAFGVRRWDLGW